MKKTFPRRGGLKRKTALYSTKRKPIAKKAKKPKKTLRGLWREWLVPDTAYHRYEGLRGIYWYWLSRDVRESEWIRWNQLCITCLEPIESWQYADCGHIIASARCGEFLRFNRNNLTIQHKGCNNPRISPNADALNAIHYDERYGIGAWKRLYDQRTVKAKTPKQQEYRDLIEALPSYQRAKVKAGEHIPAGTYIPNSTTHDSTMD
jgi:hypothetical protein